MSTLLQDLRYAVRTLTKAPGFSAAAVLTLALGIGASTSIFSVVNGVLLRPLALVDSERLVALWESKPEARQPRQRVSPPTFLDWRRQTRGLEGMAAYAEVSKTYADADSPEQLPGMSVSSGFFSLLRVVALHGRTFANAEEVWGRDKVVVLSHGLWRRSFGGSPNIVGKSITLGDERFEVVGVLPADFRFVEPADFWIPLSFAPDQIGEGARGARYLKVIARLEPGGTLAGARAGMGALALRLGEQHSNNAGWGVGMATLREDVSGGQRLPLLVLLGAVGLLLLIACGNTANMFLVRVASRQKEGAVRAALGAGRWRLIRPFLMEGLILSGLGAAAGLLLAILTLRPLLGLAPSTLPRREDIGLDPSVLIFTLSLSFLVALVVSVVPARNLFAGDLAPALRQVKGGSALNAHGGHLRRAFIVAQVALSVVLLVGSGLLIRSFVQLRSVDPGFRPEQALSLSVQLPQKKYGSHRERSGFGRQLVDRIRSLPGVEQVAVGTNLPLGGSRMVFGFFPGAFPSPGETSESAEYHSVSPDYFRTLGVPLHQGRDFTPQDDEAGTQVAVVSQTLARQQWPGESPLGKRIRTVSQNGITVREVVGVVGDVKHVGLADASAPQLYVPYAQDSWPLLTLVVRSGHDGGTLRAAIRRQVSELDRSLPVAEPVGMDRRIDASLSSNRFLMQLLATFAVLALLLATVGLVAVVGFLVSQRTHEIGIRKALGAQPSDVMRLVVGEGLLLSAVGLGLGLVAALGLTRGLSSLLFGVSPADPMTLLATCVILLAASTGAAYLPARRAARVDPMVAFRCE